jgi:hypothetical protein
MNKIIVFIIAGIIVVGGVYYAVGRGKSTTGGIPNSTSTSNQTAAKTKETCSYFQKGMESEYKANDSSILPADVAVVGSGETLCGSIASLNTVYYLTDKSDKDINDLYKSKLTAAGCTFILSATPVAGQETFSTSNSYQCSGGKVYTSTGFKVNTFSVTFSATRE